jgi:hypothetical protein
MLKTVVVTVTVDANKPKTRQEFLLISIIGIVTMFLLSSNILNVSAQTALQDTTALKGGVVGPNIVAPFPCGKSGSCGCVGAEDCFHMGTANVYRAI